MTHLIERHLVWFSQVKAAAPASLRARRRVLRHAGIRLPWGLNDADEAEIAHYLSEWNGWSRTTYYGHLRGYYRWAVRAGHLTVDPMAGIPYPGGGPRVPHPCSDAELAIALTAPQWPWRRAILLAAYNGLRCAELCRAALEDITDGWLTVQGKGGRVRVVPLAQPVIEDLVQQGPTKRLGPGKRTPLVADPDGLPISPHVLSDRQRRLWSKLGIGHMTLHSLRHWHATSMLTAGVDLRTVQELLGHASVATTQVYTEVTDQRRAAAVAALPVLNHTEPDDSRLGVANAA